jgi:GTP diphosphokinase / guanosine-3',5'-bis(diphosphate) 3'-diphosphatase
MRKTEAAGDAIPRILEALAFAADKHRMQRRKDVHASPYINHPIALAALLAQAGVTDVVALQAAILHDTVEDTETTFDELEQRFGKEVASVVAEVTDDKALRKEERKRQQVLHAPDKSREAALVKLADKTCNLRDIAASPPADWSIERKREYFDWARQVVDALPKVNAQLEAEFERAWALKP